MLQRTTMLEQSSYSGEEIMGDNTEAIEKEVLVAYSDDGYMHKRRVRFIGGIYSLRKAILICYNDILVPKIAASIGMSQADVRHAANQHAVKSVLYIAVYNDKFGENIELLDEDVVKEGDRILVDIIKKKSKSNSKNISVNEPEESYDIALEIRSMKLHIHVNDGDNHHFIPYWCNFKKLEKANGMFPPGLYRIWCPVYSQGQGFISIGGASPSGPDLYDITICGYTEISPEGNSTDVKFEVSPISDECTRIKFTKRNAYLGYDHESGRVYASSNPKERQEQFNFDFKIVELVGKYSMYYQIFNGNGEQKNGKSHLLQVTDRNSLIRVIHDVDAEYKDPASLFTIYRQSMN